MSTAQLTSQILQQVSLITEDEGKLQRALKALKRITTPKPDPTEMTSTSLSIWFARPKKALLPRCFLMKT